MSNEINRLSTDVLAKIFSYLKEPSLDLFTSYNLEIRDPRLKNLTIISGSQLTNKISVCNLESGFVRVFRTIKFCNDSTITAAAL